MNAYEDKKKLTDYLDGLGIPYTIDDHEVFLTVEDANRGRTWPGPGFKNLFLSVKKDAATYLIVMQEDRRIDYKALSELTGKARSKIRFGSEELLAEKLGIVQGAGSVFNLLNNEEGDVTLIVDRVFQETPDEQQVAFPANVNDATITVTMGDVRRFLATMNNPVLKETAEHPLAEE